MSHLPHERKMRELAELNRWAAHERLCLQVVHELSAANGIPFLFFLFSSLAH